LDIQQADAGIAAAQKALADAEASGDTERAQALRDSIAELEIKKQLAGLAQEQASLAAQNTADAKANVTLTEQQNAQAAEALRLQQQTALAQSNAEENERRLAAARERQIAGGERGEVELLPTDPAAITDEQIAQNAAAEERSRLNQQQITEQERLLELERQRAQIASSGGTGGGGSPEIPGFKAGGDFAGVRTAIVGEAGKEIVDFGGRRGYIYNAQKTAKILQNLPAPISSSPRTVAAPQSSGADTLLKEIKGLRRDLAKSPRQTVINQKNTANLRSLDQREVADIVRRSHREGIDYLQGLL
jgi:hypothetical protein